MATAPNHFADMERLRSKLSIKDKTIHELKQEVSSLKQLDRRREREITQNRETDEAMPTLVKLLKEESSVLKVTLKPMIPMVDMCFRQRSRSFRARQSRTIGKDSKPPIRCTHSR